QWTIDPTQTIDPATIDGVGLGYVGGTLDGEVEVAVLTVKYATTTSSALTTLFSSTINHRLNKGDDGIRPVTVAGSGTGDTGGDTTAADPCEEDRCCADRLIRHLNANLGYYCTLVWLGEDPNARASRFDQYPYGTGTLLDAIVNVPVSSYGDWVAFPASGADLVVDAEAT